MRRSFYRSIFALFLLFVAAAAAVAQAPDLSARLPQDAAVRVGTLPDGLRYYIRANAQPEKRAVLRLVVNAGSVLETDAQRGLAHVVEHMAFNGTQNFQKMQIVDYLESIGMKFGPEVNAYTSFDETVYMLEIPTDSAAPQETAFRILADWAARLSFDPEELRKERGVVLEEWRQGRGAGERIQDKQFPVLLQGSRYADRIPIGLPEIIQGSPPSEVVNFYHDWYRPDLMAVIAVGDFDPSRVESLLTSAFSSIPAPTRPKERVSYQVPGHPGTLYSVVTDPEATQSLVSLYVTRDVDPFVTVGDYRKRIVVSLATMMLSARLDELAQKPDPPFIQAYADVSRLVRTKEAFALGALVRTGGIERGLEAILTEAERMRAFGFTDTELARAKSDLLRGVEQAYLERDKTTSTELASEYLRNYTTSEPFPGIEAEYALHQQLLPGISLGEVNALAASFLTESNRVVLASGPAKSGVTFPDEVALAKVFDRVEAASLTAYVDQVSSAPLVENPPTPGTVTGEEKLDAVGAVRWTLSNGVKVVVKPTDFKNDQILFDAFSPGGTSLVSDSDYIAALTATGVVGEAGLDGFSSTELSKKLAGKTAQVSPYIGELYEGLRGSSAPSDLETLLQLVYLTVTQPRRDPDSFQSYKGRLQAYVANRESNPDAVFADTVRSIMTQGDSRSKPLTPELLEQMSLDGSLRVYRDRFGDAGDFTFVFVGNIDPVAFRPLAERWLGGLPTAGRRESWKDRGVLPPPRTVTADVKKGLAPKSRVVLSFAGEAPYSRDEVVQLTAMADILEIRLREQLREALSGTYDASVSASAQKYPDQQYGISIDFGCDPARVEELTKAVFKEIAWIRDGVIDETYLSKEREILTRSREEVLKQNSFWMQSIEASLENNEDPAEVLKYPERVKALTAGVIGQTARTYLTPDRYVRVVLYPEPPK